VSVVTFPAYEDTEAALRSLDEGAREPGRARAQEQNAAQAAARIAARRAKHEQKIRGI
jgi:phage head maturation protease